MVTPVRPRKVDCVLAVSILRPKPTHPIHVQKNQTNQSKETRIEKLFYVFSRWLRGFGQSWCKFSSRKWKTNSNCELFSHVVPPYDFFIQCFYDFFIQCYHGSHSTILCIKVNDTLRFLLRWACVPRENKWKISLFSPILGTIEFSKIYSQTQTQSLF